MNGPVDVLSLGENEIREFMDSFDTILSDCDGVIHIGLDSIEKSKDAIEKLRELKKTIYFVSNNCSLTLDEFTSTLKNFELTVNRDDIVIPTIAIIDYLKTIDFRKSIYLIGLKKMREEFRNAGFKIADYGPNEIEENIELIIHELRDDKEIGAVVVDVDVNLTYLRLQKAIVYLKRKEVLFITAGSDTKIPFYNNITLIGPDFFHKALTGITGREPMRFGKPSPRINKFVLSKYKLNPSRTLFIGDSFSDVQFARNGGYKTLMVLTGNVKVEDLKNPENRLFLPDYSIRKLGDLCGVLDKL